MTTIDKKFLNPIKNRKPDVHEICCECGKSISYEEIQANDFEATSKGISHSGCYYQACGKEIDDETIGELRKPLERSNCIP